MKLIFTKELPTEEGFYFWTNFGEHTPTVLEVSKNYSDNSLYASNGEYSFKIKKSSPQQELNLIENINEDDIREKDGNDCYKYGDELWCKIPNPYLPSGDRQVEPDCY